MLRSLQRRLQAAQAYELLHETGRILPASAATGPLIQPAAALQRYVRDYSAGFFPIIYIMLSRIAKNGAFMTAAPHTLFATAKKTPIFAPQRHNS
jgi:hypothetical protein